MRLTKLVTLASAIALAGCMPHPPPAAAPPEVMAQTAVVALGQIPPAVIARYLGTYRNAGNSLTVRRAGDQLIADRGGSAMPLALVGLGTFADAGGTAYLFIPADGSGGKLRTIGPDGTSRDWTR